MFRVSRVVGTGALHQSLHGLWHWPDGTDLSSGIMAAPAVTATATLASTTSSVYERVAPTTIAWTQERAVRPEARGRVYEVV